MPCLRRMTTGLQPWETSRAQSVVRLSRALARRLAREFLELQQQHRLTRRAAARSPE